MYVCISRWHSMYVRIRAYLQTHTMLSLLTPLSPPSYSPSIIPLYITPLPMYLSSSPYRYSSPTPLPHSLHPSHSSLPPSLPFISLPSPSLPPSLPHSHPTLSLPPLSALTALSSSLVPNGADCQVIHLNRPPGKSLGFSIVGGRRSPKGDCPVYIKSLAPKSIAESDGRLHCGDELVAVNNIPLRDFSQQEVVKLIRDLSGPVSLTIRISEDSSDR